MFKFGLREVKCFKLYALLKYVKNVSLHPPMKHLSGFVENDVSAVPTTLSNSTSPKSKALVTVPKFGMEALSVVPLRRKLGHQEAFYCF
ncbi:hypothetical protein L484_016193 [Morus notabilis]|uniref:Uncharacterized protein n=1 Tax=Morus notabilis TaxID=981085 RepID=W9RX03_9ROSA|nr:hypothetical protein L484_016193 [Morus notabilis]